MNLDQLIKPDSVLCNAQARSKKHCLEILSELLSRAAPNVSHEEIFAKLVERERLGCTSMDKGTAFPHCRIAGLSQSSGALIKLSSPVDFDSADGEDVDLVLGLLVPEELDESHYADVELITSLLRDEATRTRLRRASSSNELYQALAGGQRAIESSPQSADAVQV